MYRRKILFSVLLLLNIIFMQGMDDPRGSLSQDVDEALHNSDIEILKQLTQFSKFENVQQYGLPFRIFDFFSYCTSLKKLGISAAKAQQIMALNGKNVIILTNGACLLQNLIAGFSDFTSNFEYILLFIRSSSALEP